MKQLSKHPTVVAAQDLMEICKPLQKLNINYFSHVRIDHNGYFSAVASNPGFARHYLRNKYYNADIHIAKSKSLGKYILWDTLELSGSSAKMLMEAREFGHQHVFTITQRSQWGNEFYHFATHVNNHAINQLYINNVDLLEKFIDYFKDHIVENNFLMKAYDIKFGINTFATSAAIQKSVPASQCRAEFLNELQNGLILNHKNLQNKIILSPQLTLCLYHLLQGNTAKQIAHKLNISFRTVEHHIAKIRKLTGCQNVKELIAMWSGLKF